MNTTPKYQHGFTLLELMVTVAILAILATIVVPGFDQMIRQNRVTTQANAVHSLLLTARTEAVKRLGDVELVFEAGTGGGWVGTLRRASDATILRVMDYSGTSIDFGVVDGDANLPVTLAYAALGNLDDETGRTFFVQH